MSIIDIFQYSFTQNALLAALFASISCGIIGTYIVSKRIVFISGGITHASFGGIGIGYYMGLNPVFGAAVFAVLSALGIEYVSKKGKVREDSVIAVLWSFGIAVGIIFIFLTPGYAPNLMTFLFGSILTVSATDIILLVVISLVLVLFFTLFYKIILFTAFDEEYARTLNIPVQLFKNILISLVALTVVLNIRVVGIILVLSLLTIPQNTANIFVKDFKKIIYLSIIIGFVGSFAGLLASYFLDIPSGASIIFSLILIFLLSKSIQFVQIKTRIKSRSK